MTATESTPLLKLGSKPGKGLGSYFISPASRILLAGFLSSLTIGLTQVSIIYVFRHMVCRDYYGTQSNDPTPELCFGSEIDSRTATQVSILGMSTSLCGILNLLICSALIRRWGTQWAFVAQTSFLALRVLFQVIAISADGRRGMLLIQATQLIGILGGPRGYM